MQVPLRDPKIVMKLSRLGSFHQSKLSFLRSFLNEFKDWKYNRDFFDLNDRGYGVAIYSFSKDKKTYSLVCFANELKDEERSGTAWDSILEDIGELSLSGKKVAIFGLGDSSTYTENYCDAMEELHSYFIKAGAEMVGYVDKSSYTFDESKSVIGESFCGLPLDEDSESDLTDSRLETWASQLKGEIPSLG